ncbi:hypothetical protein CTZ27_13510 [Streptomyces griseocarneus]|nr:hypothetical protein CTZ27_13510 [Streptomyces griseocarneus]
MALDYLPLSAARSGVPSEPIYMLFAVDLSTCVVLHWDVKGDVRPEFVLDLLETALARHIVRLADVPSAPPRTVVRCTRRLHDTDAARTVATPGDDEVEHVMHEHRREYQAFLRRQQGVPFTMAGVHAKTWTWSDQHNDSVTYQ